MKIVAVINCKGGVGKTSLTANLAAELAWQNFKVLMIDLDPQSSLTFSFITPMSGKNHLPRLPLSRAGLSLSNQDNSFL